MAASKSRSKAKAARPTSVADYLASLGPQQRTVIEEARTFVPGNRSPTWASARTRATSPGTNAERDSGAACRRIGPTHDSDRGERLIAKLSDIEPLLREGRQNPVAVLPRLRALAAGASWQEREVAATALADLAKRHPESVLSAAASWARARDPHVRRAACEGLRGLVQRDPEGVRPILEALREDAELYVRKSVANVLRNATRTQPEFVVRVCGEWARATHPNTRWIVRHGLRKLKATRPADAARILALLAASA